MIAIDGFSSCGKSTLAKHLAAALNYIFVDSGAMYRAITFYFLKYQLDWNNETVVKNALKNIQLQFEYNSFLGKSDMLLNGLNVEEAIRTMNVSNSVSEVAAIESIRSFAVAEQQRMGFDKGIVMDGRDIGTTVFPNAELKIFVTADIEVRVERRWCELQANGIIISREEVKKNLESRDLIDSTRTVSPLRKAYDAIELNNSNLTKDEQLKLVLQWAEQAMAKA